MLTGLGFVTVGLAVWMAKRVLADKGWILALALVVPITYVTSHVTGDISSIGSLFQELAIRLLSGFLIAAVGLHDLVLMYRGTLRVRRLVAIGALCGLVAWNSQDFGVAAMAAYGLMVLVVPTSSIRWRALGSWLGGLAIGLALYPLFLLAIGSPLNLSFVGAFAKLAGSGLGSAPIQVPGPVLVVVPIIICATATGWALIVARRRRRTSDDVLLNRAAIALAFVGTWSTAGLAYYMNRGYAAAQLQTMLLPCGVCVACLALNRAPHQGVRYGTRRATRHDGTERPGRQGVAVACWRLRLPLHWHRRCSPRSRSWRQRSCSIHRRAAASPHTICPRWFRL